VLKIIGGNVREFHSVWGVVIQHLTINQSCRIIDVFVCMAVVVAPVSVTSQWIVARLHTNLSHCVAVSLHRLSPDTTSERCLSLCLSVIQWSSNHCRSPAVDSSSYFFDPSD